MRGMAKKREARYFLKDIVDIVELETTDAIIPELEAQLLLYVLLEVSPSGKKLIPIEVYIAMVARVALLRAPCYIGLCRIGGLIYSTI
jgi:hypothetical protein